MARRPGRRLRAVGVVMGGARRRRRRCRRRRSAAAAALAGAVHQAPRLELTPRSRSQSSRAALTARSVALALPRPRSQALLRAAPSSKKTLRRPLVLTLVSRLSSQSRRATAAPRVTVGGGGAAAARRGVGVALLLLRVDRGLRTYGGYFCVRHSDERAGSASCRASDRSQGRRLRRGWRQARVVLDKARAAQPRVNGAVMGFSTDITAADERTAPRARATSTT